MTKIKLNFKKVKRGIGMGVVNKYYPRALEKVIQERFKNSKVLAILGPRQCGKSTVIEHIFTGINSAKLKTQFMINSARNNPDSFVKDLEIPSFIDEIQNAPELFGSLQNVIDENNFYSQFIISGSNKIALDDRIKESLSGRVSLIEMSGLSLREINEVSFNKHFVPTEEYLTSRKRSIKEYNDIWGVIHRGSYPELYDNPEKEWEDFYSSYVQTYIEKDVLTSCKIKDLLAFNRFLIATAARTGQILDYTSIANDVGVSSVTIKEWISILLKTNIIFLLQPYYNSHLSRSIKSPKIYYRDTGLAAYLSGWLTKDQLKKGAKSGEFFETFIINELIKSFSNEGLDYSKRVYYYNGKDKTKIKKIVDGEAIEEHVQTEIDFIIEENNTLYPIEIKKKDMPDIYDAKAFDVLDKDIDKKRGVGVIFSSCKERLKLKENLICLPIEYI